MQANSSPRSPAAPTLAELAASLGVQPTAADLEAVRGFLDAILPALEELERVLPPETAPAAVFSPLEGP